MVLTHHYRRTTRIRNRSITGNLSRTGGKRRLYSYNIYCVSYYSSTSFTRKTSKTSSSSFRNSR